MDKVQTVTTEEVAANARRYLADAKQGVTTVVVEDGHAVARLVPMADQMRLAEVRNVLRRAAELRNRIDLGGDTVVSLIREARRLG